MSNPAHDAKQVESTAPDDADTDRPAAAPTFVLGRRPVGPVLRMRTGVRAGTGNSTNQQRT